jgi:hypothetical protein
VNHTGHIRAQQQRCRGHHRSIPEHSAPSSNILAPIPEVVPRFSVQRKGVSYYP